MNYKISLCLFAPVLLFEMSGSGFGASTTDNTAQALSLTEVVNEALSNNPTLMAANATWEAMRERIPQARAWADPRLGFDQRVTRFVGVPPNSFDDEKLMAEETVPISGRNRLRGDVATEEAARVLEELRRKQLDVVAKARAAYFRLGNSYKQLELNRKNSDLLKQFAEISRAKMAAGNRTQADVLIADTELAKLDEAQFDFQREISEARTELNVLMNRPPESPVGRPGDLAFEPVDLSLSDLEGLALANRPELVMAQRKIEAAQARLKAARKEWIPDPSFRVEGDRYNGAGQAVSELDAGFSVDLPWFNRSKYRAAIQEDKKMLEAAQHELEAERSETLGMVVDQFHRVETFHHHTRLYRAKLLPLARESVNAQRVGYESDKTSILEILTAQETAQDVEAMYWDHLTHYKTALAELESLIGIDLPGGSTNSASEHHHNEEGSTHE
ncbi:MAG TPA: TolC family protein [Candidatus Baltobacteraceae bacterium]|nr:TolC family protein [Candidatus Baltobacteraceae bacterium]